jgi:ABC-type nickel/cobalt efflux system permease component RcnA
VPESQKFAFPNHPLQLDGALREVKMQYYSLLIFGCLIGMQHALEADHLAAVATLSKKRSSHRALILRGSAWGLGHTITLVSICGALMLVGETISPRTEAMLELGVGLMILLLGANVLFSMWRRRPHIHVHKHSDGEPHLHVHSHESDKANHDHEHHNLGLKRALCVGLVHGMAGSAGLLILATAASSIPEAFGYVIAFGIGSILGMAALSFVASYPLRWIERCANWVSTAAFVSIGVVALGVGGNLIRNSWNVL